MWNIIKSLRYAMRRSLIFYSAIACSLLLFGFFLYDFLGNPNLSELDGSMFFTSSLILALPVELFLSLMVVSEICAGEYRDKLINYEIFAGYKRSTGVIARFVLSICYAAVVVLLIVILPTLLISAFRGWGYHISFKEAAFQLLVWFLTVVKLELFIGMLSFLTRNSIVGGVLGYLLEGAIVAYSLVVSEISLPTEENPLNQAVGILSSLFTLLNLSEPNNFYMGFAEGHDVEVYEFTYGANYFPMFFAITVLSIIAYAGVTLYVNGKRDYK